MFFFQCHKNYEIIRFRSRKFFLDFLFARQSRAAGKDMQSINQSIDRRIYKVNHQSINQSIDGKTNLRSTASINQSINQSIDGETNLRSTPSINQSINQSTNRSIDESRTVNQSINRWIDCFNHTFHLRLRTCKSILPHRSNYFLWRIRTVFVAAKFYPKHKTFSPFFRLKKRHEK